MAGMLLALAAMPAAAQAQVQAQAPLRDTALAAAVDAAWQRALAQAEGRAQLQRAQAESDAARRPWAAPPALELGHHTDRLQRDRGLRETEIALAWPLWLPGQRAARSEAAQSLMQQAQALRDQARWRVAGEVRDAYWTAIAARGELALARAHAQALKALSDDVQRRVKAGDLARADALAVSAEQLAASAQARQAELALQQALSRWQLHTGLAGESTLPEVPVGAAGAAGTASATGDLPQAHPELRAAEAAVEAARRQAESARRSRSDPPELTLGVRQDRDARGDASRGSVGVALRWPLVVLDGVRPQEAAALAELDIAQTALERARERLAAEREIAQAAWVAARQRADVQAERVALLRERAALIDKSWRAGESALPDRLRALSALADAEGEVAAEQAALGRAQSRVLQSLGVTP
jgi:outer membrane protein, heavy metal efflux system